MRKAPGCVLGILPTVATPSDLRGQELGQRRHPRAQGRSWDESPCPVVAFDKHPLKDAQQLPSAESLYDAQETCGALLILVASFLGRQPPLWNQGRQKRDPQAAQGGEGHVSL